MCRINLDDWQENGSFLILSTTAKESIATFATLARLKKHL